MAWKVFFIIFTSAFMVAYVASEIPSYIHTCGRKDPNIDNCIVSSINDLRDNICKGMPELHSPPFEPFFLDSIAISDTDNAKLFLKNSKITGLCDFVINSFHLDLDKLRFDFDVEFKKVYLNGTYDFDIHVLVPFVHQGPVYLSSDNVKAKASVDIKMVTKNDKKYIYISKMNLNLILNELKIKFDSNGNESAQLNEIISTFVGSNEEEFIARVKPSLEADITKQVLLIANTILKHFTFDELFPDRA
ncbi:uncharacterized protein LOC105836912 [Monomorium pharaonis]|uniref:uncharacterized protein LOC105836912 n=1 Tax=Monomorium pharaonis TaxID=307658 RepID=UPI00063FA1D3|nr:uncharacterized protein LOC105836912 [Monomorium pharaonis]